MFSFGGCEVFSDTAADQCLELMGAALVLGGPRPEIRLVAVNVSETLHEAHVVLGPYVLDVFVVGRPAEPGRVRPTECRRFLLRRGLPVV